MKKLKRHIKKVLKEKLKNNEVFYDAPTNKYYYKTVGDDGKEQIVMIDPDQLRTKIADQLKIDLSDYAIGADPALMNAADTLNTKADSISSAMSTHDLDQQRINEAIRRLNNHSIWVKVDCGIFTLRWPDNTTADLSGINELVDIACAISVPGAMSKQRAISILKKRGYEVINVSNDYTVYRVTKGKDTCVVKDEKLIDFAKNGPMKFFDPTLNDLQFNFGCKVEDLGGGHYKVTDGSGMVHLLGSKAEAEALARNLAAAAQGVAPSHAHVGASGASGSYDPSRHTGWNDPAADPLAGLSAKAVNTIAATDSATPDGPLKVYYHDRWPSKNAWSIIDDAIELLKTKMNISMVVRERRGCVNYSDANTSIQLSYAVKKDDPYMIPGQTSAIVSEVLLPRRAFDRLEDDLDKAAGLRGRLSTDDYIKLRIAYLLLTVSKLPDLDAKHFKADTIQVIGHETRSLFTV